MDDRRPILVTGARGMLGTDLCSVLRDAGWLVVPADIQEFDITSPSAALDFVQQHQPSVIVNCAAYTAVDQAESDSEIAFRINRDGARNLAEAALRANAWLLHISTDYVFDGTKPGA